MNKRLDPISDSKIQNLHDYPLKIRSHDHLFQRLSHFLTECMKTLFPDIKIEFIQRPNRSPEYIDLYSDFTDLVTQKVLVEILAEVKTPEEADFVSTDILNR